MSNKSCADLSQEISEIEKQEIEAINNQEQVEIELYNLSRQILLLQLERKDKNIALDKAKHNLSRIKIEKTRKTREYWGAKELGL